MKFLTFAIATILFAAVLCQENDNTTTTEITTITTETTTSDQTTSTETTTEVTTTNSEPTTTTSVKPPTTTSTTAPTTSVAPSTTSVAPSTTSVAPSTTSAVPSTTKAPEPTPPPYEQGSWNVTQGNVTCIRVEMKALFTVVVGDRKEYVALSENATTEGSNCNLSNDTQLLVLSEQNRYVLTMVFLKDGKKVFVNETIFDYTSAEGKVTGTSNDKLFTVDTGNSYKCVADVKIALGNVTMDSSHVQVQAFGAEGNTHFSQAESCDADDKVSDAVPIAVGVALAALIIVVLIAYLVGRRNSRQKGYQSV